MLRYRNKEWGFELTLPKGWYRPGFFHRLIFSAQPEFFGPHDDSIKMVTAPLSPEPDLHSHQKVIRRIAGELGHQVLEVSEIEVGGKRHATVVFEARLDSRLRRRFKNYHLVFDGTEFVVTASLESGEAAVDDIVKTFRKLPRTAPTRH